MSITLVQNGDNVSNFRRKCLYCKQQQYFSYADDFRNHLKNLHCGKEGGSFVCQYGRNNVCSILPIEGANEKEYLTHIEKVHIGLNDPNHSNEENLTISKRNSLSYLKYKDDSLLPGDIKTGWTQFPCQNLSAVLNDPKRKSRETDFFTRVWGEDFVPQVIIPLTLLPCFPRSLFLDYWKKYELKYLHHVRLKRTILAPHSGKKKDVKYKELKNEDTEIPEVFLKPDFHLEEPNTFNEVLPWNQITKKTTLQSSSGTGKLLQEKLAHYLDMIEVNLSQQIATKSSDFFLAMSSQDKLQVDVQLSCQEVKQLRLRLNEIRDRLVKVPLNMMRLMRLRERYEIVEEKLKLMATIHQTQPTIQLLLSNSDFVSALDLIETSLEVLQQELLGVQCFRHLSSQLLEMRRVIEQMMIAEFLEFTVNFLNQPHGNKIFDEEEHLVSIVLGLLHQKKFEFLQAYKVEAFAVVKSTVKKAAHDHIVEGVEYSNDQSIKFGSYIRSLSHDEWLMVLEAVFCVILHVLKNMKVVNEAILNIFHLASGIVPDNHKISFSEHNEFINSNDLASLTKESKDILWSACELAQTRCSKVIMMRAKEGALDQLSSKDFVVLARMVENFSAECESISGRQSQNFRSTLLTQAKMFVDKFHEQRKHNLSNILDIERWRQVDVPGEIQNLVNFFPEGKENSSLKSSSKVSVSSHLLVQGQRFVVVGTLLMLLKIVAEYCQCVGDVPMLALDLLTKLCEVFKLFNSRTCQIVLGAGALQTIGLKTITAKHLALAAQCLEVVILHIHIVKNYFESRIPQKQFVLLSQFDQILKDYSNHRHEVLCKIVSLMEGIFNANLASYEVRAPMPSKEMRAIVKHIIKLFEALETVFNEQQLETLFRDIRRCFKVCFAERLSQLSVECDGGPQHGLVTSDLTFYLSSLKQYSGFSDLNYKFDDIWLAIKELRLEKLKNNKHFATQINGQIKIAHK
ncbi:vacuolar protein sorting-associated protein 54 isoform X1 [Hydra vulgaris]|uniref:vacuolar protein sorting-associated protein 54 isoform X1 n=1 Tax=Hydra vulgaris TaxID=6087 RepID=UPI001F5F1270|nr:vacuolar protein sorting-associated protein 54 [Hydra vulgaris]